MVKKLRCSVWEYLNSFCDNHRFVDSHNIYEIDECHIFTRKNHQGLILVANCYVVVIFERDSKKIRL